jgi:hypothetical protein
MLRETPSPTASAPVTAPHRAPTLQAPWNPGMSTLAERRCTEMAWVFIDTSSAPWKRPQSRKATKNIATDPATPMSGPEAQ